MIDYSFIEDNHLSWKAKGLFFYMKTVEFQTGKEIFNNNDFIYLGKDSNDSIRSGLKELEREGYILKETKKNEKGQFYEIGWKIIWKS